MYRHYTTSRKYEGSNHGEVIEFLNVPNPSSRTIVQLFSGSITEISTRRCFWGKALPADNLTAISKPTVNTYGGSGPRLYSSFVARMLLTVAFLS
jgi:hypothetical protein